MAVDNVSNDYESTISSQQLWLEGKTVSGFNLALLASLYPDKVQAAMRAIVDMLASGKLPPTPAKLFGLDEVRQAHDFLQSGAITGSVLLRVAPNTYYVRSYEILVGRGEGTMDYGF